MRGDANSEGVSAGRIAACNRAVANHIVICVHRIQNTDVDRSILQRDVDAIEGHVVRAKQSQRMNGVGAQERIAARAGCLTECNRVRPPL